MKKYKIYGLLLAFITLGFLNSCNDYVQDIEEPIDNVADKDLDTPEDIAFLTIGVLNEWALTWDEHSLFADGMSDAMEFTNDIKQATYPTYDALDKALIQGSNPLLPSNNSTEAIFSELGRVRLYADTLITRINTKVNWDATNEDQMAIKTNGLYTAYFVGAIARYMYSMYWALNPTNDNGGGVINVSAYIPSSVLIPDALARLDSAIKYAPDEATIAQIHTLKARIYLVTGDFTKAKAEADLGMASGADPFQVLYNTVGSNQWYVWAGPGRTQFHAADRFGDYVYNDPNEAARIPLYIIKGKANVTFTNDTIIAGVTYKAGTPVKRSYMQENKYTEYGSPINFLTWQENHLMLAELAIRSNDNAGGLALVNEVRASYGIAPLTEQNIQDMYQGNYIDMIYVERDKELCFTGMRLLDQRRLNKWHLDPATTWQFMPISNAERMSNPNL